MPRVDHYAVLLAINYYPGIGNLLGPENDLAAFHGWLTRSDGGDVDPANIDVIKSSDYSQVRDSNDADPTERRLIKKLDARVRDPQRAWRNRVGERLYLYMAGHGFTAGSSISDPALFSAVAQAGDTAHIAGYRIAAKIANAKFFDEIVLVMDCCQDVLKASQVVEPTWSPPDRNGAATVKLLQAYGAPRGQAAYERDDPPGSAVRGNFSRVLIEALDTACADAAGFVTGQALKNQFLQIWGSKYKGETGYDPPIRTPDTQDIQLIRRNPTVAIPARVRPVTFHVAPPIPENGELQIMPSGKTAPIETMPAATPKPVLLPPGLYKLVLTQTERSRLFEVTGADDGAIEL